MNSLTDSLLSLVPNFQLFQLLFVSHSSFRCLIFSLAPRISLLSSSFLLSFLILHLFFPVVFVFSLSVSHNSNNNLHEGYAPGYRSLKCKCRTHTYTLVRRCKTLSWQRKRGNVIFSNSQCECVILSLRGFTHRLCGSCYALMQTH